MLIPRFTLRWMMGIFALLGGIFFLGAWGMRGNPLAMSAFLLILFVPFVLLGHAVSFFFVYLLSRLLPQRYLVNRGPAFSFESTPSVNPFGTPPLGNPFKTSSAEPTPAESQPQNTPDSSES